MSLQADVLIAEADVFRQQHAGQFINSFMRKQSTSRVSDEVMDRQNETSVDR